ncbi:hypothetical protein F4805DRAFT_216051 [Annulohypoxylon moriforme]|nr:hypothetical protein F4805DRAFT_216051 [Annulohypoxylon moriforme]
MSSGSMSSEDWMQVLADRNNPSPDVQPLQPQMGVLNTSDQSLGQASAQQQEEQPQAPQAAQATLGSPFDFQQRSSGSSRYPSTSPSVASASSQLTFNPNVPMYTQYPHAPYAPVAGSMAGTSNAPQYYGQYQPQIPFNANQSHASVSSTVGGPQYSQPQYPPHLQPIVSNDFPLPHPLLIQPTNQSANFFSARSRSSSPIQLFPLSYRSNLCVNANELTR